VQGKKTSALERAGAFLKEQLQDGRVEYQTLLVRARSAGLSKRTLDRAKPDVGVYSEEEGPNKARKHYWTLEKPTSVDAILAASDPLPQPG